MPEFTRMSISLPQELRDRMDAVQDSINWSAVAQQGFEEKLSSIARADEPTVAAAIARLRGTVADRTGAEYRRGLEAGRHWAMNDATVAELRRLREFFDRLEAGGGFDAWLAKNRETSERLGHAVFSKWHNAGSIASCVKEIPFEADDFAYRSIAAAKAMFGGEANMAKDRLLAGFVGGALAFWGEVENLI